jgi:Integrase core domain
MGWMAVYPKPRLRQPGAGAQLYPDVLTGVKIERPDHVWSTDMTYVRLSQGFVSLVALRDGYSRDVLAWEVSGTFDSSFGVSALERALIRPQPAICNADQGAQCTSLAFTKPLWAHGVLISRDGRGRVFDNIFVGFRSATYRSPSCGQRSCSPMLDEATGFCAKSPVTPYSDTRAIMLSDESFRQGGLQRTSYARPAKMFTANHELMMAEVGVLTMESLRQVTNAVVEVLHSGLQA